MSEKTITIEIDEHGNSSVDLAGFQGKSCVDVTKALRAQDVVAKSESKREFHIKATSVQRHRQGR